MVITSGQISVRCSVNWCKNDSKCNKILQVKNKYDIWRAENTANLLTSKKRVR